MSALVVTSDPSDTPLESIEEQPNINDLLSNEILAIILGKLDLKSRLMAERVCTQWRQHITRMTDFKTTLCMDWAQELRNYLRRCIGPVLPKHIEHIVLSDFVPQSASQVAKLRAIGQIVAKYKRIHTLMALFNDMNADVIKSLCLQPNHHLLNLIFVYNGNDTLIITTEEAQLVAQNYPNLTELYVDTRRDAVMSESVVELLLKGLPALNAFTLKAEFGQQYTGRVFEHINAGIIYINTTGNLLNATAISRLAAKGVDQLQQLKVTRFDPNCMPLIGTHFTTLRVLVIDPFSETFEEFPLEPLFASISRLIHLEVLAVLLSPLPSTGPPHIDNRLIDGLEECLKLHSLRLSCAVVAEDFMDAIADNIPGLRKLILEFVVFDAEDMTPCLAPIERLRHLSSLAILGNRDLTDTAFEALIVNSLQITEINVSFADSLTIDSMVTCVEVCGQKPNRSLTVVFSARLKTLFEILSLTIPKNLVIKYQ